MPLDGTAATWAADSAASLPHVARARLNARKAAFDKQQQQQQQELSDAATSAAVADAESGLGARVGLGRDAPRHASRSTFLTSLQAESISEQRERAAQGSAAPARRGAAAAAASSSDEPVEEQYSVTTAIHKQIIQLAIDVTERQQRRQGKTYSELRAMLQHRPTVVGEACCLAMLEDAIMQSESPVGLPKTISAGDGGLHGAVADWRTKRTVAGIKLHHDDDEGRPLRSWFDFRTAGEAGRLLRQSLAKLPAGLNEA